MIFRVNKNKNYTCMSNHHLKDRNLSLKAKGLLSIMLSLPDNWDFSINGLTAICIESRGVVKNILSELKNNNYLVITKLKPNQTKTGRFEYVYDIFEEPQKQNIEKQGIEKQPLVFSNQYNTNKLNTKKLNTKRIYSDGKKKKVVISEQFKHNYSSDFWDQFLI